ncbi:D-Ala-D-Ala carboxypeptidase family metallohydrolase [Microbulbifer sp. 2205BS26-8]|uniref:D-Ala-D-Ala carboxypeptidase family metallohydrolase n=1 Tax=Microbulbifer sp. 2205BS26-8 TaxID=3064386 RepID=UPI00273E8CA4|nr:D-Ala-D-Ala carboxypeptidase family metallohydrolase [Microbulbifer sp. 2205BS26-8]MDP5210978.1 hypothetical protein [Microbulbifer sp. 2205BS26-8]
MIDITTPASKNYFTVQELQCRCADCEEERNNGEGARGCASNVKEWFLSHLNRVRERVYCRPMPVTSGYRCTHHPIEASKAKRAMQEGRSHILGDHPCGVAVDVGVYGKDAHYLMQALHVYNWLHTQKELPQPFTAICPNQRGPHHKRFIHIGGNTDAPGRKRPWIWTY